MTANLPFWNLVGNDKILLCVKLFTERKSCFYFFNSELSGFLAFHGKVFSCWVSEVSDVE